MRRTLSLACNCSHVIFSWSLAGVMLNNLRRVVHHSCKVCIDWPLHVNTMI